MVRTTIVMDENLMKQIKMKALENGKTLKATIASMLYDSLSVGKEKGGSGKFKWNTFQGGGASVAVHDRNALFAKMDEVA